MVSFCNQQQLGKLGILQGWEYTPNPRFKDAPQKGEFSIARSVFRAVVVGMVVATAVVLTGGAVLVLVAGVKVAFVAICKSVAAGVFQIITYTQIRVTEAHSNEFLEVD